MRKKRSSQKAADSLSLKRSGKTYSLFLLFFILLTLPVTIFLVNQQTRFLQHAATSTNLLQNGSFENTGTSWLSPWNFNVNSTGSGTITQDNTTQAGGSSSALINVTKYANFWDVQLGQSIPLVAGQTYTVTFFAKAAVNRAIHVSLQQSSSPYTEYYGE